MSQNTGQILIPIGYVKHNSPGVPRHYSMSDIKGEIRIYSDYQPGLGQYLKGDPDRIMVLFLFDRSPEFTAERLLQQPPNRDLKRGVFWTCSPVRPNPVGVSILSVLEVKSDRILVRGLDMLNKTPVIDIKAWKDNFNIPFPA